jgi:hypothetical protein
VKILITPPREINEYTIRNFFVTVCNVINKRLGNIPDDSEATDVAGVVEDLNALQDILR